MLSCTPSVMPSHKKLSELIIIDNYDPSHNDVFNILDNDLLFEDLLLLPNLEDNEHYLTTRDFNYTMHLLDNKILSLYKLCRYISDQQ